MPLILSVSCMEEHFIAAREEWNCRIVKKKKSPKSRLASFLTLKMISLRGSPLGTDLQGEASFEIRAL